MAQDVRLIRAKRHADADLKALLAHGEIEVASGPTGRQSPAQG
jgi:hypothetical protein